MSDDEILEQAASSRGKPLGDSFEAVDLFRDYLENKLSDLKNDISKQTSKQNRKTPSFRLESHRIQFEFNTDILEGLESLSPNLKQQDSDIRKDLISKPKKRNKLIKVADRFPGAGLQLRAVYTIIFSCTKLLYKKNWPRKSDNDEVYIHSKNFTLVSNFLREITH